MTDEQKGAVPRGEIWPELPFEAWRDTYDTLQLWTQIVGKVRLAKAPMVNHWWQVPLYVTCRGLTTSPIPHESGRCFQVDFDFISHRLLIEVSDGRTESLPLAPRPVADFYRELMDRLKTLGLEVRIWTMPVEIPDPVPFHIETAPEEMHGARLPKKPRAELFEHPVHFDQRAPALMSAAGIVVGVLAVVFRSRAFPVVLRRPIQPLPIWPIVTREVYSHEVSNCGFWPGKGLGHPAFYSYAYPEPAGLPDALIGPGADITAANSMSLFCLTMPFAERRRRTNSCSNSSRAPTRPSRMSAIGIAPSSSAERSGVSALPRALTGS